MTALRPVAVIRRHWIYLLAIQAPLLTLVVLLAAPDLDIEFLAADAHLAIMTVVAVCALAVATMAVNASVRTRQPRMVMLASGCLGVGILFLGHGLTTPTVLGQPSNEWVGRLSYLALAWFTLCLAMASIRRTTRLLTVVARRPIVTLAAVVVLFAPLTTLATLDPTALHGASQFPHEATIRTIIAFGTVATLMPVSWSYWRRFQLSLDIVQASLSIAAVLTTAAILSMHFGEKWRLSWWDYHGCLLAGFAGVAYAVLRRWRATRTAAGALDSAFSHDPITLISANYPTPLRSLVEAMEEKDANTHGHSARTAALAVSLGVRLGLESDDLRVLAQGSYLHDIGKLAVPNHVLNKPGPLTEEEWEIVATHPTVGCHLAGGHHVLHPCLPIIRHHHERMDGAGYPDGLTGPDIPLLARIAAVADVWDALTSDRSYRPGWAPEKALDHILEGAGEHLDPVVVASLLDIAADQGIRPTGVAGDPSAIDTATSDCHEVLGNGSDLLPGLRARLDRRRAGR